MKLQPLSPVIGVEVAGVDLSSPLAEVDREALRRAFATYHLLLFRGQDVTPEQQREFAEIFGPTVTSHTTRPSDGLMFISNREMGGAVGDGTLPFHSDHSYFERPDTSALLLYAIEVPGSGGETLFANMVKAYEDLPAELKARIVGLHARHKSTARPETAIQPLARFVADDGPPALYVSQFCDSGIEELPGPEGDVLLSQLFKHLYREELLYKHAWRAGDLIIWSNRVLQHARTAFDPAEPRTLRRSTQGVPETVIEVPAAAGSALS